MEKLEGPVTPAELQAFKSFMRTVPVPTDNGRNMMVYGTGGSSVESLGRMFTLSGGDRELLDIMLRFTDAMLAARNDPETGHIIWTGQRDPVWPNAAPAEGKQAYAGSETGDVMGHISHAALLILRNEELAAETVPDGDPHHFGKTYLHRALRYVHDMDETLDAFVLKWLVRPGTLRLHQPDSPAYDAASRPNSSNKPMPWNQQMMVLNGVQRLAECHALLGAEDDLARARQCDAIVQAAIDWFFEKAQRITVNGHACYRWTYAAEDPMVHIEDSAHGGYDVGGLCRAHTSGRYRLTAEMMRPFASTVLHIMRQPADGFRFAGRVDGTAASKRPPGTLRGHWIDLCEFEPALLPVLHEANKGRIKSSADTAAFLIWQRHRLAMREDAR
ncbi:MAG: hypothetical protein ACO1TE_28730 [Prosthecobacter sp.]